MTTIKLRGHHLLCLLGYRGKGYSEGFCMNMTSIYETLRLHPETRIEVIEGPDDICRAFPKDQHPHCENDSVYEKDAEVISRLGLSVGETDSWSNVCERVSNNVQPADIRTICTNCRWEPLGLCKEGVEHIHGDRVLRPLL
ncbi:DUF1284 domain-containing protein [Paenibacillus soyae]|uniref:DUF1284 domain-containing protein n=1 Tax=Paenibacillus soyae TaxID=2969249 RepID=A0A9X2MUP7_9BACL|nr:DUF1284 domain-containing protein [Paenibacillus soyae]MCR2806895.1 DUF1284 domain-containing protein [Paenibacillus soyae]